MEESKYLAFLKSKMAIARDTGFEVEPQSLNSALLPHQKDIVAWAIRGGRRAIFAKFGLGKTVMEVEFCKQVIAHEGGKALIILPLGVKQESSSQTMREFVTVILMSGTSQQHRSMKQPCSGASEARLIKSS